MAPAVVLHVAMVLGLGSGGTLAQDCNLNGVADSTDLAACVGGDPACADCNQNGVPDECDLAVRRAFSNRVAIDPGFAANARPNPIAVAQLNTGTSTGDVFPDLVVGDLDRNNTGTDEIRFLINDGNGGVDAANSVSVATGKSIVDLVAVDLNNDDLVDVATANFRGDAADNVSVLLRTDTAGELPLTVATTTYDLNTANCTASGCRVTGITQGLLNDDDFADLAVVGSASGELYILTNNAEGVGAAVTFTVSQTISVPLEPIRVVVLDFDDDQDNDLAVNSRATDVITIYPNDGSGNFVVAEAVTLTLVGMSPFGLIAADVDGNGSDDLLTTNEDSGDISLFLDDNNGASFLSEERFSVGTGTPIPTGVRVGDLDGDGDNDLVAANSGSDSLTVLLQNAAGQFVDPFAGSNPAKLVTGVEPRNVVVVDLDGDGTTDLVSTDQGSNELSFFSGVQIVPEEDCQPDGVPDSCDGGCGNRPPVAVCRDVTACPDGNNMAAVTPAEIDDGSSDPNGDSFDLGLSPVGPYADGQVVTLTVTEEGTPDLFSSTCEATVTVADLPLSVTCPVAPPPLPVDGGCTAAIPDFIAQTVVVGACSGAVSVFQSPAAGVLVGPGLQAVTVTVDDDGAMASCEVLLDVVDQDAPVITLNGDPSVAIACGDTFTDDGASALDGCDGSVAVVVSANDVDNFQPGTYSVDYQSTDSSGNIAVAFREVIVTDEEDPSITSCASDITVEANTLACTFVGSVGTPIAEDECGTVVLSNDAPAQFLLGATIVTWTATDLGGNTAMCTQTVTVTDEPLDGGGAGTVAGPVSFISLPPFDVEDRPLVVFAENLTSDSNPDLVVGHSRESDIRIYRGNGDGTFTFDGEFPTGERALGMAFADLNADGAVDIVTANEQADVELDGAKHVTVLLNSTLGVPPLAYAATHLEIGDGSINDAPSGVVIAQLVGDAALDIAVCSRRSNRITIFTNDGAGGFTEFQSFTEAVSDDLLGLAALDVDEDGATDLVASGRATNDVAVFRNDVAVSGDFVSVGPLTGFGPGPGDILGFGNDVDGDGLDDLLTINETGASFSVALNQDQSAVFAPTESVSTGASAFRIRAADINCDETPDVLTVSETEGGFSVHLNESVPGTIAFASRVAFNTGAEPTGLAVADFNQDGQVDVAVSNKDDDNVVILLNTTCGSIGTGADCDGNGILDKCQIAGDPSLDLDFNGVLDSCEGGPNQAPVAVCQNVTVPAGELTCSAVLSPANADGGSFDPDGDPLIRTLSPAGPYPVGQTQVTLTVRDPRGGFDSCLAVITVEDVSPPVLDCPADVVLEANSPTCTFTGTIAQPPVTDCSEVVLTTDAPSELVVGASVITWTATDSSGRVSTCTQLISVTDVPQPGGTGVGVSFNSVEFDVAPAPAGVWAGDINGDDRPDLFSGHLNGNELRVYFNNGFGEFVEGPSIPTGARPVGVVLRDLDGDLRLDVAVANSDDATRHVTVALNKDGTGANFQVADITDYTLGLGTLDDAPVGIASEDFTLNGKPDLVVCSPDSNAVTFLRNDGDGAFSEFQTIVDPQANEAFRLVALHMTEDNRFDVMVANRLSDSVTRIRNDVHLGGAMTRISSLTSFSSIPHDITAEDMDGDGLPEVLVAAADTDRFYALQNIDLSSGFNGPFPFQSGNETRGIRTGDFDCDGFPDVVTANEEGAEITIHLNKGTPGTLDFESPVDFAAGAGTVFVAVADFDGDGDDDVVSANRVANTLTIFTSGCAGGADCNRNNILDNCDIAANPTLDADENGLIDACDGADCNQNEINDLDELGGNDCNGNLIPDDCELDGNDCNLDGVPDVCQLAGNDCNGDGVPDSCQIEGNDCNADGILDSCQLVGNDCNLDGIPDDCQLLEADCDGNLMPDDCQLVGNDCDDDGVPDNCQLAENDCNRNGIPDTCELGPNDCNDNGIPDDCDLLQNDCNENRVPDDCDIAGGGSLDVDPSNGLPDECDLADCNGNGLEDTLDVAIGSSPDCNGNGRPDECDLAQGLELDCNNTRIPDSCEVAAGTSSDCDSNGRPDECDVSDGGDCDGNGVPDACELSAGTRKDCNGNGIPDLCDLISEVERDCDGSGVPDSCELEAGTHQDCDSNGVPDVCDIDVGEADCDSNGVPDVCDFSGAVPDCNFNGIPDPCELAAGDAEDCNDNAILDVCDIARGDSFDENFDGIPDECSGLHIPGDCNNDASLDIADPICLLTILFSGEGPTLPCGSTPTGSGINSPGNSRLLDATGTTGVDISDGIRILNFLFNGGLPHVLAVEGNEVEGCAPIAGCPGNPLCAR